MPCACENCLQHCGTLGLPGEPPSKASIRKAYRSAAKRWHPDRFENNPRLRPEAEEHFKLVQVAYRELSEHCERPKEWPVEVTFAVPARTRQEPAIWFGGAAGCFSAPDFPPFAEQIIASHFQEADRALAIVDLSGAGQQAGSFSRYILLTTQRIFVRDAHHIVSLIWYSDLGKIDFVDWRRNGILRVWQRIMEKISGAGQKYSLHIYRRNGTHFCSIADQVDDRVKKVIYNFLQKKIGQRNG